MKRVKLHISNPLEKGERFLRRVDIAPVDHDSHVPNPQLALKQNVSMTLPFPQPLSYLIAHQLLSASSVGFFFFWCCLFVSERPALVVLFLKYFFSIAMEGCETLFSKPVSLTFCLWTKPTTVLYKCLFGKFKPLFPFTDLSFSSFSPLLPSHLPMLPFWKICSVASVMLAEYQ